MAPPIDVSCANLPAAQQEIWPRLAPAPKLGFVLYGGTAVALHLAHRVSVDFDFFRTEPLDKADVERAFDLVAGATVLQESENTLVVAAAMPSGPVKVSLFGGLAFGRLDPPVATRDGVLLVASLADLLATKLKAILDRAEAKDYHDIAAMLAAGVPLERSLAGFSAMFGRDPMLPLRALGYFKDGDLPSLPAEVQQTLRAARDRVAAVPEVKLTAGSLAAR